MTTSRSCVHNRALHDHDPPLNPQTGEIVTLGRRRLASIATGVAVALGAGLLASATPAPAVPPPFIGGWLPSWDLNNETGGRTQPILDTNKDLINEVDLFVTHLEPVGKGVLIASDAPSDAHFDGALNALKANGHKVLITSTDETPAGHLASVLKRPPARASLVQQLVNQAADPRIDGVDLDYENFAFEDGRSTWKKTSKNWRIFIKQLSVALHAQGKMLSMTVPPVYNFKQKSNSGAWVYSVGQLWPWVDRIKVMAYNYSFATPGPIAPLNWADSMMRKLRTRIPGEKLQLGIPAYGYDWVQLMRTKKKKKIKPRIIGKCPVDKGVSTSRRTIAAKDVDKYLTDLGLSRANIVRDAAGEALVKYALTYTGVNAQGLPTQCTVWREAHLSDATSITARAQIARKYGLQGAFLWTLWFSDKNQWEMLNALT